MGRDDAVLTTQGRRISLMADELSALLQRVRSIERRVSLLEDHVSVLLSSLGGREDREGR